LTQNDQIERGNTYGERVVLGSQPRPIPGSGLYSTPQIFATPY